MENDSGGHQTHNDSGELQMENDSGGHQTHNDSGRRTTVVSFRWGTRVVGIRRTTTVNGERQW